MVASFFHGVKTQYVADGAAGITGVPTAVIAIVGTAPTGPVNKPTLINSDTQAAEIFGVRQSGFTLGYAIDAVIDHGAGLIIAVNVADNATHRSTVAPASFTFPASGVIQLPHRYLISITVTGTGGTPTYVAGTDYTVDLNRGTISRRATGGAIAAGATVLIGYVRPDATGVTPANIIGGVDAQARRTGLQALLDIRSLYGFDPTIILAPTYCELVSVSSEMIIIAEKVRGMALIDAPVAATRDEAIAGRNGTAPVSNFNTSSPRAILCYPRLKIFDLVTNTDILEPFSERLAGVMAQTDANLGFWWSPSNKEIKGITGVERLLYTSYTDENSDSNLLNAAGIVSYLQAFGGGIRTWGNRSAAYPTITTPENFIAIQRVRDYIAKSIENASLQFLDRPINMGLIDSIMATILGFLDEQTVVGALLPGSSCKFLATDNPPSSLQKGIAIFTIAIMPPPPAEQIIYKQRLDTNLLAAIAA